MNDTLELTTKDAFLAHFDTVDFAFDESFSQEKRDAAKKALAQLEFPTSKTEYWKYTRLNKLIKGNYSLNYPENELDIDLAIPSKNCLVFVNGNFNEELSFTEGVDGIQFSTLSAAKANNEVLKKHFASLTKEDEIFAVFNTAYHQDGAFLHAQKNVQNKEPYYIINLYDDDAVLANPRNFIYLEEGSEVSVILKNINSGKSGGFANMVSEIIVERNAFLELNKIQDEGNNAQIANEEVRQYADSRFKINTFTLSGSLIRNNLNIHLLGQHTETWLNGLYPTHGKQHVDNHTFVYHREPNCVSHELYKGILNDQSTGVFNGKVYVHQEAQKTNAYQSNANILMTEGASVNSKPELEIYADDVKCSHGSTTGQLDEEALFYLRARGLSKASARAVLVNAFAADVIEHIGPEVVKEEIEAFIDKNYQGIK